MFSALVRGFDMFNSSVYHYVWGAKVRFNCRSFLCNIGLIGTFVLVSSCDFFGGKDEKKGEASKQTTMEVKKDGSDETLPAGEGMDEKTKEENEIAMLTKSLDGLSVSKLEVWNDRMPTVKLDNAPSHKKKAIITGLLKCNGEKSKGVIDAKVLRGDDRMHLEGARSFDCNVSGEEKIYFFSLESFFEEKETIEFRIRLKDEAGKYGAMKTYTHAVSVKDVN